MNPWSTNPCWQNFSSLYREVVAAQESSSEVGKFHHLTSSLYFGIAALEAFLNQQMREHLRDTLSSDEILKALRREKFIKKLHNWPLEILKKPLSVTDRSLSFINTSNNIRGDLTHPKTNGYDTYESLETINPESVLISVAEYIVCYHNASDKVYPYWLFGWNYVNPRSDIHEIILINNQQFLHSLRIMGFRAPSWDADHADQWQKENMTSFDGYLKIKKALAGIAGCEPRDARFPYQPKLCRRWWEYNRHHSCVCSPK